MCEIGVKVDQRFRNGSKKFLRRLGVSNGFLVFLFVSGSSVASNGSIDSNES